MSMFEIKRPKRGRHKLTTRGRHKLTTRGRSRRSDDEEAEENVLERLMNREINRKRKNL